MRFRPSQRSWDADLAELRTADGRELPTFLRAELDRLKRRLALARDLIREMETVRSFALEDAPQDETSLKIEAVNGGGKSRQSGAGISRRSLRALD